MAVDNRTVRKPYTQSDVREKKDAETIVGNSVATILTVGAGVLAVIGLMVGFDMISNQNPFENGLLWLATAITTALGANVFRREHHIIDEDEVRRRDVVDPRTR